MGQPESLFFRSFNTRKPNMHHKMNPEAGKMEYVERLAYRVDPDYDEEENLCGSRSLFAFERDYERLELPFTRQQYLDHTDIVDTVEAYGMDVECFWRAVQYIYFLNERKCVGVFMAFPPVGEQLRQAVEYYRQHRNVEWVLQARGKRKLILFDPHALKVAFGAIEALLERHPQDLQYAGVDLNHGKTGYPLSVQRCHVAKLFLTLFELLDLPDGGTLPVRDGVSYNKLLLISRLIYLMRLTDTPSYLDDENALKACLRDYGEVEIRSFV